MYEHEIPTHLATPAAEQAVEDLRQAHGLGEHVELMARSEVGIREKDTDHLMREEEQRALIEAASRLPEIAFSSPDWFGEEELTDEIRQQMKFADRLLDAAPEFDGRLQQELANVIAARGGGRALVARIHIQNESHFTPPQVAEALISSGEYETLLYNVDQFSGLDIASIARLAIASGKVDAVISRWSRMEIPPTEIIDAALECNAFSQLVYQPIILENLTSRQTEELKDKFFANPWELPSLWRNLKYIKAIDPTEVAKRAIESENAWMLYEEQPSVEPDWEQLMQPLIEAKAYAVLLLNSDKLPNLNIGTDQLIAGAVEDESSFLLAMKAGLSPALDPDKIYEALLESDNALAIVNYIDNFPNADPNTLIDNLLASYTQGFYIDAICSLFEKYPEIDKASKIERLIQVGGAKDFILYGRDVTAFPDSQLINIMLKNGKVAEILRQNELLKVKEEPLKKYVIDSLNGDLTGLSEHDFTTLNVYAQDEIPSLERPEALQLVNRIMKTCGATIRGYEIVTALKKGIILDDASEIGVTETGIKGLEQFGAICRTLTEEMLEVTLDDEAIERIRSSSLLLGIFQKVYRIDRTAWGAFSPEEIRQAMEYYAQHSTEIDPLDPAFTRKMDSVLTLDADNEYVTITEDVRDRFGALYNDIENAILTLELEQQPFDSMLHTLGNEIKSTIRSLEEDLAYLASSSSVDAATDFRRKNTLRRRESLEGLLADVEEGKYVGENFVLRSPADLPEVLNRLAEFTHLHSQMRTIAFAWALRHNDGLRDQLGDVSQDATVDGIGVVREFIETIVNEQTFGEHFSSPKDKKAKQQFRKIFSVRALDDALERNQKNGRAGAAQTLEIIPTRGIGMEFSGQVGDACWAGQYDNIAEEFPNITAILFKRGEKGSQNERLVGSAMMIRTTDISGNGVLILRGVNPTENFINKTKVEDFYRAVTEYCREVAAKIDCTPAIVIDAAPAAAGTNRPAFHAYTKQLEPHLERINLGPDTKETKFNNLEISGITFAI